MGMLGAGELQGHGRVAYRSAAQSAITSAQTCVSTNGGFTISHVHRTAADVDDHFVAGLQAGQGVDEGQRDTLSTGSARRCPEVHSPIIVAAGRQMDGVAGAQHTAAGRLEPVQTTAPGPASFSAHQRVAAEELRLVPADGPRAAGLHRRDVLGLSSWPCSA
ncbi:MAG: hypothetical protein QM703_19125 [Gemmatales bacterium]